MWGNKKFKLLQQIAEDVHAIRIALTATKDIKSLAVQIDEPTKQEGK